MIRLKDILDEHPVSHPDHEMVNGCLFRQNLAGYTIWDEPRPEMLEVDAFKGMEAKRGKRRRFVYLNVCRGGEIIPLRSQYFGYNDPVPRQLVFFPGNGAEPVVYKDGQYSATPDEVFAACKAVQASLETEDAE
ncbi:hypothetical protein KY328_02480 [Candidatus Woesearchaeota archaeon]|nr:hypothetical protein [Candidatus Woesearchaeota archaeon]MBW3021758.1 hypothetical protein [Candidatus Woesearchaeota archaeon]